MQIVYLDLIIDNGHTREAVRLLKQVPGFDVFFGSTNDTIVIRGPSAVVADSQLGRVVVAFHDKYDAAKALGWTDERAAHVAAIGALAAHLRNERELAPWGQGAHLINPNQPSQRNVQ